MCHSMYELVSRKNALLQQPDGLTHVQLQLCCSAQETNFLSSPRCTQVSSSELPFSSHEGFASNPRVLLGLWVHGLRIHQRLCTAINHYIF